MEDEQFSYQNWITNSPHDDYRTESNGSQNAAVRAMNSLSQQPLTDGG